MVDLLNVESCGDMISDWWRGRTATKLLLVAAAGAVLVYTIGDVLAGLLYEGYSWSDQAISELTAFGSPVRPLMVSIILTHNLLMLLFGVGMLRVADRRTLRWIGILLVVCFVVVGLPTHTIWAMSSRGLETGFNDAMHITLSMVFSVLVVAMMALSAAAYRGLFRVYSLATLVVVAGFGAASGVAMSGLEQDDTPWAGTFERINAYAYFAWLVALAAMVICRELGARSGSRESGEPRHDVTIAA